jgi:hypothetical protein
MFDEEHHRPPARRRARRRLAAAALGLLTVLTAATLGHTPQAAADTDGRIDPSRGQAAKPYLGWSSWSLQSSNYPGLNPDGGGSWLNEQHVLQQADVMAKKLAKHGYEYVNIDAGWQGGADQYGRPVANQDRFPDGIKYVADRVHDRGLKLGVYTVVGLGKDVYDDGKMPVYGAPECHSSDLVYPDLRTTNGWDMSYKIDFDSPCAQRYIDSVADVFASWGVDLLKIDGVGPGSFKGGANYDNIADIAAWSKALHDTGRPITFVLSWALAHTEADTWKQYSNGWRIDTDVECYCNTLVQWNSSVKQRWNDVVQWIDDAGPGHWNNLDSLDVGVGEMDGLNRDERQSYATLWAIESAPLYIGDDLTRLDPYGLSLITNDEVIAIDQAGNPARPVSQASRQQVWYAKNADGTYTVALFNLDDQKSAPVTADFNDLGFTGTADVRDVWQRKGLGSFTDTITATLPPHGSRLFRITPKHPDPTLPAAPVDVHGTAATATSVSLAWRTVAPGVQPRATSFDVYADGTPVATGVTDTRATVDGLAPGSSHRFTVRARSSAGTSSVPSSALELSTPAAGGPTGYEAEDPANPRTGNAGVADCPACSGAAKVGNIGGSSTLTITDVAAPADGTYLVKIDYVDGDVSREAEFDVDGVDGGRWVTFPGTGDNDWATPRSITVPLQLKAGDNKITISSPGGNGPDIDKITA